MREDQRTMEWESEYEKKQFRRIGRMDNLGIGKRHSHTSRRVVVHRLFMSEKESIIEWFKTCID